MTRWFVRIAFDDQVHYIDQDCRHDAEEMYRLCRLVAAPGIRLDVVSVPDPTEPDDADEDAPAVSGRAFFDAFRAPQSDDGVPS